VHVSTHPPRSSLFAKVGKVIATIGMTVAFVSAICATNPSLRDEASGFFLFGVGAVFVGGFILAVPVLRGSINFHALRHIIRR
jgi:hypothetical protein